MIKFMVDSENSAENFWYEIDKKIAEGKEINQNITNLIGTENDPIFLENDEAKRFEGWLQKQPFWSDEDYPNFAKHPILITEVDENDDDYQEWLEGRNWQ